MEYPCWEKKKRSKFLQLGSMMRIYVLNLTVWFQDSAFFWRFHWNTLKMELVRTHGVDTNRWWFMTKFMVYRCKKHSFFNASPVKQCFLSLKKKNSYFKSMHAWAYGWPNSAHRSFLVCIQLRHLLSTPWIRQYQSLSFKSMLSYGRTLTFNSRIISNECLCKNLAGFKSPSVQL